MNIFTKKLNKKGFTLAELLIVVAIVAILIAIAIPIYTSAMQDAQIKVNQSNARALKGAAVSQILTHWTDTEAGGGTYKYSQGSTLKVGSKAAESATTASEACGWYAFARFDETGKMGTVHVRVNLGADGTDEAVDSSSGDQVMPVPESYNDDTTTTITLGDDAAELAESGAVANPNVVIVFLKGTDVNK